MSKPVNAFFNIRISGVRNGQTPTLLVSGVLHCVKQVSPDQYLPVAYYTDGATGSENSLNNVRVTTDTFSFASGVLGPRLHIDTLAFTVTVTNGAIAYSSKPADPAAFTEYDMTFTLLDMTATAAVPVPSYNEIDSDVVLTTASPTAWNRPQPTGSEIVIKSNVLTLIYSALYAKDSTNSLDYYAILGNTDDLATVPDTDVAQTKVWQFKTAAEGGHYDPVKDQFNFNKSGDTNNTLSCEAVDKILLGIAPDILQANDTLDITVNGIDSDTRNLYTTTLTYTGATSASANGEQYPKNLFAGLLEKNMAAYQSKQAICIAVSKYNLGKGLNTTENPPFSFSYKKSGLFKVLDEVILDFTKYYYIVYHFAQAGTFVRALRLFSKPTANADALKDVIVLAGKHDAYVDLELAAPPTSQFTNIGITYTYDSSGNHFTGTIAHSSAGRGTFQLFILESDLYTARKISEPATGSRLRVYFGTNPLPGTTFKIEIAATNPTTACSFQGSISKRNILNLTSLPAAMTSFVELKKSNWDSYLSTIGTIAAQTAAKSSFNYDISQWDLVGGGITSLSGWLQDFKAFDQHLGNWNTSNVTDMSNMFKGATSFNRPIDTWDTSNVKNMEGMFEGATGFNQSLVGWNVASVSSSTTDTSGISTTLASSRGFTRMFKGASTFDGDISTWTSASKAGANQMFEGASSFDRPFSATAGKPFTVIACEAMFHGASAFNQDWVAQQIFADGCTSTKNTFKGAISLGSGKTWSPHTLPASCQTAESMFEGAYSLNRALDSSGNPRLTSMVSMYKGASAFNSPVRVSGLEASLLLCNSMFEKAVLMNSAVTLTNSFYAPAVSYIQMNRMFLDAVKFNQNVVFTPRRVVSAQQMFQGASSYGNDDNDKPKPTLGKAYGCEIVYGSPPDVSGVAMPFQYMFAGTRFDDRVTGTGPRDCSYMFAGATYFNTQLGINFMPTGTTTLEGMFQGASSLEVSPFYDGTLTVARTDNSGNVLTDTSGAILVNVTQPYLDFMKTVTSLKNVFKGATRFNPDITRWGTRLRSSSSRDYTSAFESATSFNQDLPSNWPAGVFTNMFANAISYAFDKTWTTVAPTTTEAPAPTTQAPAPTTEAPTTEAPTTEAPTTEAPTTEAPTTEAPTTEAPTANVEFVSEWGVAFRIVGDELYENDVRNTKGGPGGWLSDRAYAREQDPAEHLWIVAYFTGIDDAVLQPGELHTGGLVRVGTIQPWSTCPSATEIETLSEDHISWTSPVSWSGTLPSGLTLMV